MHQFQVDDYVIWVDEDVTQGGRILAIRDDICEVEDEYGLNSELPLSALTYLPPVLLSGEDYLAIVRLERDPLDFLAGNMLENIVNVDALTIRIEDVLLALQKRARDEVDRYLFSNWCDFIKYEFGKMSGRDEKEIYCEWDVLDNMLDNLCYPWREFQSDPLQDAIQECIAFLADRDKPFTERRYPLYIKEKLIGDLEREVVMNEASEEQITLYRLFVEELAKVDNKRALHALGYGTYGGNRAFPCDWERSREVITRYYEISTDDTERAFLANTLGYIYYYGRCNGGVPEYEKAYRYFDFAAWSGVYEAQYKIADMYKNGYGVPKSLEISHNIIYRLYKENLKHISEGNFDCKFADVALRMGSIFVEYENEEDCDWDTAFYYYLQAEFAIRMRMMEMNYYGDSKVSGAITKAIAEAKAHIGFQSTESIHYYSLSGMFEAALSEGKKVDLCITKCGELTYRMTFKAHNRKEEKIGRRMFLTVPEFELSGLFSEYTLTYYPTEELSESLLSKELVIDEMRFDALCYDGEPLIQICGYFLLEKQKNKDARTYRFVSVTFGGDKLYDYLCEDESVAVGDKVRVLAAGEEKVVTVRRTFHKTEQEMSLPLHAYKAVLGKV